MSRLIDKLNIVAKTMPEPMGFRANQPSSPKPQMLLIASLTQVENAESLADNVAGADAVLLNITKPQAGTKILQAVAQSLPDIPWGRWLADIGNKEIAATVQAGGDFVVFPVTGTVSDIPEEDKTGKILQIDLSHSDGLLKAINELPVDAVLAVPEQEESSLTWFQLMVFQHFATVLSRPLLVSAPLNITAGELKALWTAGVDGVVVRVNTEQPAGRLQELRRTIDDLRLLTPRKRGKTEVMLPFSGKKIITETDVEDEDEYEDE